MEVRRIIMKKTILLFVRSVGLSVVLSVALGFTATAGFAQAQRHSGNQWLTNEVRHQLVLLPFYSVFDNLAFRIDGDKVTLSGQVTRPNIKDDAGKAVKGIEGVASVDNQIQVLPPSPMDDQI